MWCFFWLLLAVLFIVGFFSRNVLIQWFSADFFYSFPFSQTNLLSFLFFIYICVVALNFHCGSVPNFNLSSMIISCCLIAIKLVSPEFYDRMIPFNYSVFSAIVFARKALNISMRIHVNIFYVMICCHSCFMPCLSIAFAILKKSER